MLIRLTKKTIETLEFRGILIVLTIVGALILYFSAFHGRRTASEDTKPPPSVPAGDPAPPDRY